MAHNVLALNKRYSSDLTSLAYKSKAYWGYPEEWMKIWRDDLKVDVAYFDTYQVYGVTLNEKVIGFYSYKIEKREAYMDMLFVDPLHIGKKIGSNLLSHCLNQVGHQAASIYLHADPHAQRFYEKHGFVNTGQLETVIPERFLPIMTFHF